MLTVKQTSFENRTDSTGPVTQVSGKLCLVDLAGSEVIEPDHRHVQVTAFVSSLFYRLLFASTCILASQTHHYADLLKLTLIGMRFNV